MASQQTELLLTQIRRRGVSEIIGALSGGLDLKRVAEMVLALDARLAAEAKHRGL